MQDIRITDVLPVLTIGSVVDCALAVADVENIAYSPALLLPADFGALIVATPEYADGSRLGFECYFEEMYVWDGEGETLVFAPRVYGWEQVQAFVMSDGEGVSFLFGVGFVLGWLSALALSDRALALRGLALFSGLAGNVLRRVGGDGWPLDL